MTGRLPGVQYFMALWGIPRNFGGMTGVTLRRAAMFQAELGRPVPVLTFEAVARTAETRRLLIEQERLDRETQILNIFHWIRANGCPLPRIRVAELDETAPMSLEGAPAGEIPGWDGPIGPQEVIEDDDGRPFFRQIRTADAETVLLRDLLRPDGSVVMRDLTLPAVGSRPRHRRVYSYSVEGRLTGVWTRIHDLYRDWVSALVGDRKTVVITDSSVTRPILVPLSSERILVFTVLHSSHIRPGSSPLTAPIAPGQWDVHRDVSKWDGIVFLTEAQRNAHEERFGRTTNTYVIPNPSPRLDSAPPESERQDNRGVMIARLAPIKNPLEAVEIMKTVTATNPGIILDIYGAGPLEKKLRDAVRTAGLGTVVRVQGHEPNAARHFATSRFSLLTSTFEGQGISIAEALGRGCPVVTYDAPFGPGEVVRDGTDGFVVAVGNRAAAAERILEICCNRELASKLSANAWEGAHRFAEGPVLVAWGESVRNAFERRSEKMILRSVELKIESSTIAYNGATRIEGRLEVTAGAESALLDDLDLEVVIRNRGTGKWKALSETAVSREDRSWRFVGEVTAPRDFPEPVAGKDLADVYVRLHGGNVSRWLRVPYGPDDAPSVEVDQKCGLQVIP